MKCLFIHTGHDGSITIIVDKKIIVHHQIDRFNRLKHSALPSHALLQRIEELNINFDLIYITFLDEDNCTLIWLKFLKQYNLIKNAKIEYSMQHHKYHAYTTLYTTGIQDIFIFDRAGANLNNQIEQESFYKNMQLINTNFKSQTYKGLGWRYTDVTQQLGFGEHGDAKTMAYADYNQKAKKAQIDFEKNSLKLITSVFKNEVGLGGGCAQNVINNYKLNKHLKVKVCPFNGDFGISIGAANCYFNNQLNPFKNVNTGFDLKYNYSFKTCNVSLKEVAVLLKDEVVGVMYGKSEQGQRGLGFRSLLANPLNKSSIKKLNKIKKREKFRPFACSILHEYGKDYFEDYFYSPYMMFVFKCKGQATKNVSSISATSRAQSVTKEHGHYYNLISAFNDLNKCPFILNTSLNLPGHVLVETFDDLRYMMSLTELKYVYLPDHNKLIINENR